MQQEVRRYPRTQEAIEAERAEQQQQMPTLSYADVTAAAERHIAQCQHNADREPGEARTYQFFAAGAHQLWIALTFGKQAAGDHERLQAMVEAIQPVQK